MKHEQSCIVIFLLVLWVGAIPSTVDFGWQMKKQPVITRP